MEIEKVVYHGLEQTADHLRIEAMVHVIDPLPYVVQVPAEFSRVFLVYLDYWIGKKTYASLDGIVVGGKKIVEKLIRCGDIFALEVVGDCM